jgi:hypothetical protein
MAIVLENWTRFITGILIISHGLRNPEDLKC